MTIRLKRVYEQAARDDGCRILVERLWPRGIKKADARIDLWLKDLAPSTTLRKWFDHNPARWTEFKRRYYTELASNQDVVDALMQRVRNGSVTFVYASKETQFNNAVALKEFIERRSKA